MSQSDRIVQVGVAPNEAIAMWWKQILEDEGIVVMLRPGGIGQGYFANALNEHYILAREDQAEEAIEILNDLIDADETEFAES
jgi:hypothetical protein